MLNTAVTVVALLLSCSLSGTLAVPLERRATGQLITSCTVPNTVALTFDDGPYHYLNYTVDLLKKAGAKGTFFFNGDNWSCIYNDEMVHQVQYAFSNGFQIASHTWAHEHLPTLTYQQVDSQMSQTEDAIRKITGATPAYTRPPYGEYNNVTLEVAGARNQVLVTWDFDSQDSLGASVADQKKLYDDVVARHPSNILSLQHEVYNTSIYEVLPYAIQVLQKAGYKLVTLAECLGTNPYLHVGPPSPRDNTWTC